MRLFIALPAQSAFLDEIRPFLHSVQRIWPGVKWIPEKQIHLTVKFLGETGEFLRITKALDTIKFSPFSASLGQGLLVLGKEEQARIIALKLESSAFGELFKMVEDILFHCGVPREGRAFLPHITVGRIKEAVSRKTALDKLSGAEPLPSAEYRCEGLHLYESILKKEGPEYIVRGSYPFKESGRP